MHYPENHVRKGDPAFKNEKKEKKRTAVLSPCSKMNIQECVDLYVVYQFVRVIMICSDMYHSIFTTLKNKGSSPMLV